MRSGYFFISRDMKVSIFQTVYWKKKRLNQEDQENLRKEYEETSIAG